MDEAIVCQKPFAAMQLAHGKAANTLAAPRYLCLHCRGFERRRKASDKCVDGVSFMEADTCHDRGNMPSRVGLPSSGLSVVVCMKYI